MIKDIIFIDIFEDNKWIVESNGQANLATVLEHEGYDSTAFAYLYRNIDYDYIYKRNPDVIGFSINEDSYHLVKRTIQKIKATMPNTRIWIGGYLPTYNYEEVMLDIAEVDISFIGESELTILELVSAINHNECLNNVTGIAYRDHHQIVYNGFHKQIVDLDILPFPKHDVMVKHNLNYMQVEGARGCSCRCTFCSVHDFNSNGHSDKSKVWRTKSTKRVVDEIEFMVNKYGVNRFQFLDSSFENPNRNVKRIREICEEIIERKLNITYRIQFRGDLHSFITDELMTLMIESGLIGVFIGIESFHDDDLRFFAKMSKREDSIKTIEFVQKYPINLDIGMINFHPYATLESFKANVKYLHRFKLGSRLLGVKKLLVYRGTPIYEKLLKENMYDGGYLDPDGYSFNDKRIEYLYEHINNYIEKVNSTENSFNEIEVFVNSHVALIYHLHRFATEIDDTVALDIIGSYKNTFDETLGILNTVNFDWLLNLIEVAEKGWNEEVAEDVTKEYMGLEKLRSLHKKMKIGNMKLHKALIRHNKIFSKQL